MTHEFFWYFLGPVWLNLKIKASLKLKKKRHKSVFGKHTLSLRVELIEPQAQTRLSKLGRLKAKTPFFFFRE